MKCCIIVLNYTLYWFQKSANSDLTFCQTYQVIPVEFNSDVWFRKLKHTWSSAINAKNFMNVLDYIACFLRNNRKTLCSKHQSYKCHSSYQNKSERHYVPSHTGCLFELKSLINLVGVNLCYHGGSLLKPVLININWIWQFICKRELNTKIIIISLVYFVLFISHWLFGCYCYWKLGWHNF